MAMAMALASSSAFAFQVTASVQRPSSVSHNFDHLHTFILSTLKIPQRRIDISKAIKNTSQKLLDAFVDSMFQFVDQPWLPSQRNFAPVEEIGGLFQITSIEGGIPAGFPEGVYIRNGPNPLFGGLKSTVSMFGRSNYTWVEGEGMLHALYFKKDIRGNWIVSYNNRYVQTETFKLEKQRNRPSFLPALEGDSSAIISAYMLNVLRFGKINKYISNTNIFEHSEKYYSIAENDLPQEIDILTLETFDNWDINGAWDRPFTSHPKRAPGTGELVIMGVDAVKPYFVIGVISADGKLCHKADLKLERCSLSHEIGLTQRYNVIMDHPLIIDLNRLVRGGPLMKYNKEGYARIGVMPRYGDADSTRWFDVEPHCTFHILNCFEDGDEVVVRGCKALESILPGPDFGHNKLEWFSKRFKPIASDGKKTDDSTEVGFFTRAYEWRLNMATGKVKEKYLTGIDLSMDFPTINEHYTGLRNKYGYTIVVDHRASSSSGMPKYGGLAKLYFEEPDTSVLKDESSEDMIKVEYHKFADNNFCSGAAFVPKQGSLEEDDGWIISFVHNEETNVSQVHIVDTKNFEGEPTAKITLPQRVPYGFHATFITMPRQR